jgi:hypothetical protein
VARELGTEAYDEVGGGGKLRYLQLTATARAGVGKELRAQDDPLAAVQVRRRTIRAAVRL